MDDIAENFAAVAETTIFLQYEPLAEFPEGEEFAVVLVCGGARLRLVLA